MEFPDYGQRLRHELELPKVALVNPEINDSLKQISIVYYGKLQDVIFPIPNVLFENLEILKLENSAIHLKDFQTILKRCTQLQSLTYISHTDWV